MERGLEGKKRAWAGFFFLLFLRPLTLFGGRANTLSAGVRAGCVIWRVSWTAKSCLEGKNFEGGGLGVNGMEWNGCVCAKGAEKKERQKLTALAIGPRPPSRVGVPRCTGSEMRQKRCRREEKQQGEEKNEGARLWWKGGGRTSLFSHSFSPCRSPRRRPVFSHLRNHG